MSLLLKALQKADEERNSAPATRAHELSLQPLDLASSPGKTHFHGAPPSPAQAATMMAAANQRAGIADYVRERPLIVFAAFAALFLAGYFVWVYLQLAPRSQPSQPSPPQLVAAPAASQPMSAQVVAPVAMESSQSTSLATPASSGPSQVATARSPAQSNATLAVTPAAAAPPRATTEAGRLIEARQSTSANTGTRPTGGTVIYKADVGTSAPIAKRSPQPIGQLRVSASGHTIDVSRDAKPAEVNRELASAYRALQEGRLADAESLYHKLAQAEPRSADVLLGLAAIAVQQAKPELASEFYFRVLEFDPKNPHAQAGLISVGGQADRLNAETRLKQLISREPTAFLNFVLGNLYADQANWAAAQAAYFQAHHLEPSHPDYAFNLAIGLEHLSQRKLAADYYRRALALASAKRHASFDVASVAQHIADLAASGE